MRVTIIAGLGPAGVAQLADAIDSKSIGETRVGSSPTTGTMMKTSGVRLGFFSEDIKYRVKDLIR